MAFVRCVNCGRFMFRIAKNKMVYNNNHWVKHAPYICGLCQPKRFSDYEMERILKDFKKDEIHA